jgi:hypothetical protein
VELCLENSIGFWVAVSADRGLHGRQANLPPATLAVLPGFTVMSEKPKFHSKMIKDGRWTVAVNTGYGPALHVGNFATEEEATRWIATDSKNWSQLADKPK